MCVCVCTKDAKGEEKKKQKWDNRHRHTTFWETIIQMIGLGNQRKKKY